MKKLFTPLLFFFLGFLSIGMVQMLTRCEKYGDPSSDAINPAETIMNVDLEAIKKVASDIESVLLIADQDAIDEMVLDETVDLYRVHEVPYTSEELMAIGNAFKNRELLTATENLAEYEYAIEGQKYILTVGRDHEGVWKIFRY
jgi:hypothetical protein